MRRGCQPNSFTDPEDNQVTAEQFGEGVDRMRAELTGLGLPEPEYEAVSFMLRCTVRAAEVREQGTGESTLKSSLKIVAMIKEDPSVTTDEMARLTGLARRSVTKQLTKLKQDGHIRRVGPAKGGHWEVADAKEEK